MWSERANRDSWAISSVVEHFVDIEGVTSSNLVSPTMNPALAQCKIRHEPVTADINITCTAITCTSLRETPLLISGDPGRIRTCNLPLRRAFDPRFYSYISNACEQPTSHCVKFLPIHGNKSVQNPTQFGQHFYLWISTKPSKHSLIPPRRKNPSTVILSDTDPRLWSALDMRVSQARRIYQFWPTRKLQPSVQIKVQN